MVAEPITAPDLETPSQLPESPSDSPEFTPSVQPDAEPADTPDDATLVAEDEPEEPEQPTTPTLEGALEKRKALERGDNTVSLSADDYRLLQEHDRAEANRRRDFEEQRDKQRKQAEEIDTAHATATTQITDEVFKLSSWLQKFEGEVDDITRENVTQRINTLVNNLKDNATKIVEEPRLQRQRDMLLGAYGENPSTETLHAITGLKTQDQILAYTYEMGRAAGQGESAPDGKVLVDKKDYDRWTAADAADEQAKHPDRVPPSGRPGAGGSKPYSAMTADERAKLTPEERDRLTSGVS